MFDRTSTITASARDTGLEDDDIVAAKTAPHTFHPGGRAQETSGSTASGFAKFTEGVKDFVQNAATHIDHLKHAFDGLFDVEHQVDLDWQNTELYPELQAQAQLRRSNELHPHEQTFLDRRKRRAARALQDFLQLDEEVDPEDVPIIHLGGSGGGARAMLGYLAVVEVFQEEGLWDLISYISGVSGSCWTLGAMYAVFGLSAASALDHFGVISKHHPLSRIAIAKVLESPKGGYFLFGPLVNKRRTGLVIQPLDLYGSCVTCYQFLPAHAKNDPEPPELRREWLQWSKTFEREGIKDGSAPLPILLAVRHERPWRDWKSPTEAFSSNDNRSDEHNKAEDAWWQSFEFTPIETGCAELKGWIPTWAFGRLFKSGASEQNAPEQSLAQILGLCTSAPAGPLSAYTATLLRNIPGKTFGASVNRISDDIAKEWPEEVDHLQNSNPVHASNEPNPWFEIQVEDKEINGFENSPRVHLVDAGMYNNLPLDPAIRPGRNVDLSIQFDASSDVQKGAAVQRINDWASEHGCAFNPRVKLEPLQPVPLQPGTDQPRQLSADEIRERFKGRYAEILDGTLLDTADCGNAGKEIHEVDGVRYNVHNAPVATMESMMVYMPLLPNAVQPEYDPSTAKFSSSYNLTWTAEQVATIRKTSNQNTRDSIPILRNAIREIYELKKAKRLSAQ